MRLTKLEGLLAAVIACVLAAAVTVLWRRASPADETNTRGACAPENPAPAAMRVTEASATRLDRKPDAAARRASDTGQRVVPDGARVPSPAAARPFRAAVPQGLTPGEQAVAEWERVVDGAIAETNTPVEIRAHAVKEAFDKISEDAREENIRRLLNLTPNDQFGLVNEILFDKSYSENVLDAIFSDALNRPEAIKVPIMRKLVLDKKHPMFFQSARILDVTGP